LYLKITTMNLRFYFAGKIGHTDWRNTLVRDLRNAAAYDVESGPFHVVHNHFADHLPMSLLHVVQTGPAIWECWEYHPGKRQNALGISIKIRRSLEKPESKI
jgi:hypothetical protein